MRERPIERERDFKRGREIRVLRESPTRNLVLRVGDPQNEGSGSVTPTKNLK